MRNKSNVLDNKCPSCGAPIKYIPSLNKWKCEYCNSEFTLEEMQKHNNASSLENNKIEIEDNFTDYVTYTCQDCGAEIVADSETAATFCVYCGNTAILKNKLSGKFAPESIIPFKKEKKDAEIAFTKVAKGKLFVPSDFTKKENIEKIKGIYIPFWLYDIEVFGNVECSATKVKHWSTSRISYTKTDYYKLYRSGSMKFFKVPVDGSKRFGNDIMSSIEPFEYNDLVKYNHAYLSGFFAERYDVSSEEAFSDARNRALESGKKAVLDDCKEFSSKTITNNNLNTSIIDKHYVLLPVWMVNVKYKKRNYLFAMNGQTGEFIGNLPLDKKKVFLWALFVFSIVFVGIIIISYITFLGE